MNADSMIKITVNGFVGILVALSLILGISNKNTTSVIWKTQQDFYEDISQIKIDLAVIKGKLQIYENLPIDLRARIEILETRYENLLFFKKEIVDKEKPQPPKNGKVVK